MNRLLRRRLFGAVTLTGAALALTGCAWLQTLTTSLVPDAGTTPTTPASGTAVQQVLADLQGGLTTIQNVVTGAAQFLSGPVMLQVNSDLGAAESGLASLLGSVSTVGTQAGASTVQSVGNLLADLANALVAALSGISGASSWLDLAQAVIALLPGVYTFAAGLLGAAAVAHALPQPQMSVSQARQFLGIPTVAP